MRQPVSENKMLTLKTRDMGIAGAIIVLAQFLSSFQSSQNISKELYEFKKEFEDSKVEHEKDFVRKTEIYVLSQKLDRISDQVSNLRVAVYNHGGDQAKLRLQFCRPYSSFSYLGRKLKYD